MGYKTFALLVILLSPAAAFGSVGTKGFSLGLDLHTSRIGADEPSSDAPAGTVFIDRNGGGAIMKLGWGFTPRFGLRLMVSGASHATSDPDIDVIYSSGTIEAVYYFREGEPLRPEIFGGLGGFSVESRDGGYDYKTTGGGAVFGGGIAYFLSRDFALDFELRADLVNWDTNTARIDLGGGNEVVVETPIDEDGSAVHFAFGGTWWF